jgi:hypothetical protein
MKHEGVAMNRFIPVVFAGLALATPAAAAARCDGDFQLVRGSWVSTPYCRAVQIAIVARENGVHVSPETLLSHPARAEEVCRFVRSDYRVHPACEQLHAIFEWAW